MAFRIALHDTRSGEQLVGGLAFVDGAATVDQLGDNRRRFFAALGADITDTDIPTPENAAEVAALTVAELKRLAEHHGITHSSKTRHDRLAALISAHLFPEED